MQASEIATPPWDLKLLYDGECPLCTREVALLRRRDERGRIEFEDIAAPGFDATRYGLDQRSVMARIHGVLPDGTLIEGMEVFRRAYTAVGLGWLLAPSRWPGIGRLFDAAYRVFARNRLRWTGRAHAACEAGHCEVAPPPVPRGS
jgi:predicted DCC family thiol-disulfide oxidoreductase YuxK